MCCICTAHGDAGRGRPIGELDAGLPPIMGDASKLRQVIHNLVQNALDATDAPRPGREVVGSAHPEHGEPARACA
jgi:signal transduction histidine kinase